MKKFKKLFCLFSALHLFCLFALGESKTKQVLFISSYSYDWTTVPKQLKGYSEAIDKKTTTHYLFMDTKKVPFDKDGPFVKEFYSHIETLKDYQGEYDLVVAADDAALLFSLENKDSLFKDIPIVFLGIDSYDLAKKAHDTGQMTGYFESHYDSENLDLVDSVFPNLETLHVLTDDTLSGKASRVGFENAYNEKKHTYKISYINSTDLSFKEWVDKVSTVNKSEALYLLNMTKDKYGNYYSGSISERVYTYARAPLVNPLGRADYATIGISIDYYNMGRDAALTANRILEGTSPSDIPISIAEPTKLANYIEMERYGLKLPGRFLRKFQMINKPGSFLQKHNKLILFILITSIIIQLIISLIRVYRESKKKEIFIDQLKKAKNAQMDFLSKMSHDMRTPMNAIIGLSEFGLTEPILDKDKYYFAQILSSSKYLMKLLNDLLDMSTMEKGKIILYPTIVNTKDLYSEIITIIRPIADEKHIKIKSDFSNHTFKNVLIDKYRTEQLLINVLNNAIKYSQKDSQIEWYIKDDKKGEQEGLTFIIKDYGIGIGKDFQKKIFNPFEQEQKIQSKEVDGSGLGLSITKNLLDLMNGEISFTSEEDKGSIFNIFIPLYGNHLFVEEEKEEKEEKNNEAKKKNKDEISLKGLKALVCDDNEINRMIAEKHLQNFGAETESAKNGLEAVKKAKTEKFSFIIMDIRMPVMDGIEAAKKIREFDKKNPIIALSANAYEKDKNDSLAAGMNAHETKPLNASSLYKTIKGLL